MSSQIHLPLHFVTKSHKSRHSLGAWRHLLKMTPTEGIWKLSGTSNKTEKINPKYVKQEANLSRSSWNSWCSLKHIDQHEVHHKNQVSSRTRMLFCNFFTHQFSQLLFLARPFSIQLIFFNSISDLVPRTQDFGNVRSESEHSFAINGKLQRHCSLMQPYWLQMKANMEKNCI